MVVNIEAEDLEMQRMYVVASSFDEGLGGELGKSRYAGCIVSSEKCVFAITGC